MRGVILVSALVALAGCGDDTIDKGRAAAASRLKDPGSAQFRGDYITSIGSVCGEINGKNGFGAYSGFERYMSSRGNSGDFTAIVASEDASGLIDILCTKPAKK
jgi:hypothetical protein